MRSTVPPAAEPSTATDRELVEFALQGDQYGYEQLLLRYQDRLFRSISITIGSQAIAEEIVQEAFIQAFLHLHTMRHQSTFYTWLYRIALNSRRKNLRHHNRTLQFVNNVSREDYATTDPNDSPPRSLERKEECARVRSALNQLNDKHREILILREFEGFDYQTIADTMDIDLGTVRSRLSRARSQFREALTLYYRPLDEFVGGRSVVN